MMMSKKFHDDADRLLSGLKWEEADTRRVLSTIEEERPKMKTKIRWGLVLAVILVLMAAVALAVGLRYSANYTALQTARQAATEQYGLTTEMLTLFTEKEIKPGHQWILEVPGGGFLQSDKMGAYTLTMNDDHEATVSWTHDGVDAALWRNGDLSAPVWGAPQLEQVLERYHYYRAWQEDQREDMTLAQSEKRYEELQRALSPLPVPESVDAPRPATLDSEERSAEATADGAMATDGIMPQPTGIPVAALADSATQETAAEAAAPAVTPSVAGDAQTAAKAALLERYGVSAEAVDTLFTLSSIDLTKESCVVTYTPFENGYANGLDWRWYQALSPKLGVYRVYMSADCRRVTNATWSLAGEDAAAYDETSWGGAKAYDGRILTWVLDLLQANRTIADRYPEEQTEWFSVEDAAAYDGAFRQAGFDDYDHALPKAGDISAEEAKALARQAMQAEFGLTDDDLAQRTLTAEYLMTDGGIWRIGFYGSDGMGSVSLNAANGEVLHVSLDSGAGSNG